MHNARRMNRRLVFALCLVLSSAAFAQGVDPLRNVSGTTPAVGASPWIQSGSGSLTFFHGFDAHLIYASQTGPEKQKTATFSTNWFGAGVQLALGDRAFVLGRGRVSLEPYTMEDERYPQLFQYVPEEGLIDEMRAQNLIGEVAVQVGYRPSNGTLLSVYGAVVGQPALGAAPAQLRASGVDFAEAPFAYEIQESTHDATSVITAGFTTRLFAIEGSVFHDTISTGNHTELDTGDIDSRSARITFTPTPSLAVQVSRGELGEDLAQRNITSASISYGGPSAALTAIYTSREFPEDAARESEKAYGIELALHGSRNTFLARAEHVDRPAGFPLTTGPGLEAATHYTAGYIFDLFPTARYKAGLGVNVDYRTKTRELQDVYGHKPQGIYAFVRFRT